MQNKSGTQAVSKINFSTQLVDSQMEKKSPDDKQLVLFYMFFISVHFIEMMCYNVQYTSEYLSTVDQFKPE